MNDADNGENSPESGKAALDRPQNNGRKRRRWRKRKKQTTDAKTGNTGVLPGADSQTDRPAHQLTGDATKVAAINSCKPEDNSAADDSAANEFGIKKKSRRKRFRHRSGISANNTNSSQIDENEQVTAGTPRHRRQPMAQEKSAKYSAEPDTKSKSHKNRQEYQGKASSNNNADEGHKKAFHPSTHQNRPRRFYAALDLGTNNCRLLVAVPQGPGRFRVVDAFSRIVRLGEGLGSSGRLSDAAMDRTIEALKVCRDKLNLRTHTRYRLIATEACRRAENGVAFLARVREEAGLDLEIVDRATEARLAVSGCGSLVDHKAHGVVLFDIGGGSSELALLDISKRRSRRLSDHITSWASLPLGVVTLSEKFGGGKNVSPQIFEDMVAEVARMLDQFEGRDALSHILQKDRFHLLGTSGTVTTLAGVHLNLRRYDRRRVDGTWLSDHEVDAMIKRILSMSFEDRVNNPCIGADRADLVLAGCAILEAIRRLWPSPRLRVADRGLREGLLSEMMAEDGVWRRNKKRSPRSDNSRHSRNN